MFRSTEDLIPNTIKRRQRDKSRPYAIVLSPSGTRQQVNFSDLDNYSNRAAWILNRLPGRDVLYMGPSDVRYAIWFIAAAKTGKCVVFPSLANNVTANQRFFETVGSKTLLYAPEAKSTLGALLEAVDGSVECIATPSYDEMTDNEPALEYPFDGTFSEEAQQGPFLCLHTSGTSGHPKPIFWNHPAMWAMMSYLDPTINSADGQPVVDGFGQVVQGSTILVPTAMSHFSGLCFAMTGLYADMTLILPSPGTSLTPENLTYILQEGKCSSAFFAPFMLESIMYYPPGLEALKQVRHIAYAGGPLNPVRGKALAEQVPHLFDVMASSEGGPLCLYPTTDNAHWNSFRFYHVGQRMDEIAPGIFELVYTRSELVDRTHAYFHTHPHIKIGGEFRTSDLFSRIDDEWWVYRGRADNWMAVGNGLKIDPTHLEDAVGSLPAVQGVLMAGTQRPSLCLLVELAPGAQKDQSDNGHFHERMLESLWPTIEAANAKVDRFGRVPRELVLFASPDKPFQRASKGTIQRRLTVEAYDSEINALYEEAQSGLLVTGYTLPSSLDYEDLVPYLETLCKETLLEENLDKHSSGAGTAIDGDGDILAKTLDSRSAFVLLARLKSVLRQRGVAEAVTQRIDERLLFTAATVHQLASEVGELVRSWTVTAATSQGWTFN